jgi:diguanylate cyclase (GGDEF)-like protein
MSSKPKQRRRLGGVTRAWLFTSSLALGAAVMTAVVWDWDSVGAPIDLPWWAVAVAVYITELTVVHLRFRKDAHTVSMSELALVAGLFLAAPVHMIIGQALGNFLALAINRRQPTVKLAFNVAQFTLVATIEIIAFRAISQDGGPLEPMSWLAAIVATLVGMLVSNMAINAVIRLVGGHLDKQEIHEVLMLSTVASSLNTGLALVGVAVIWVAPQAFALALVPPVALFIAYRAYVSQREERARLESLYRATRMLHESPQIEGALTAAVKHAHSMFDAELVEIAIFASGESAAYLTVLVGGESVEIMGARELTSVPKAWKEYGQRRLAFVLDEGGGTSPSGRAIVDAVVAPLHLSDGVTGVLLAANRMGDIDTFTESDVKLLETLARQVSVSLENGRLEESLVALTDLKEEMRHRANHDSLTQLANRRLFIETVSQRLDEPTAGDLAVLFVDLDDFKAVNDTYGHAAGDQMLIAVAHRLTSVCRAADVVSRFGGDEFAILLSKRDSDAEVVAQRIIRQLAASMSIAGRSVTAKASIGIAYGRHGRTSEQVLREADAAMYTVKRAGKSGFRVFEPGMREQLSSNLNLRSELEEAIRLDQVDLVYQPIVSFRTGRITGVEALARWYHPGKGTLLPGTFIPLAEETGLINELGRSILRKALRQAQLWREQFPFHDMKMSVNLSPVQLVDRDFVAEVRAIVTETGVDPRQLVLEITENVLMQTATETLEALKALGIKLAIDDFGTGYSSLSYLDRLPIDIVKVDKSFVDRLAEGESPLVRTVLQIGEALGVETIVEGVEREQQIAMLQTIGCDQGQGFYFAAPLAPPEVERIITTQLELAADRRASPHLRLVG